MFWFYRDFSTFFFNRLQLAALHQNENGGRGQARGKDGRLQFKIKFPKYKKGRHVVAKVAKPATVGKKGKIINSQNANYRAFLLFYLNYLEKQIPFTKLTAYYLH